MYRVGLDNRMRITIILPGDGIAGGVRVVATYAERLQQRGHQVSVVIPPSPPPAWREYLRGFLRGKLFRYSVPPSHFDNTTIKPLRLERFRPVTANDLPDADVVIATWWETAEWVAKLPPAKGKKLYLVQHDERYLTTKPAERVKATWQMPLHKIVIAQWLADVISQETGCNDITLIPNSVDSVKFSAAPRGKQAVPTVGLMYSLVPWKGCDISIKAVELARQAIPNLRVVAFGADVASAQLPLPANSSYVQHPAQSDLKNFYAQCDAWLFGSRFEGFGLPILEAMACRTPVIGTPTGAAPELLAEGAGILVKPEDPVDMARGIEQICSMSDASWQTMSELAHQRATNYTWEDATDLFEKTLYQISALSPVA
jgi:glycosyltransferase involved in cell wall biosynthesis